MYEPYRYYLNLERPVSKVFSDMETRGICIDIPYLWKLQQSLEEQRKPIIADIKKELGEINLNSPKQLLGALHEKGIKPELKGKPSTDKRALERFRETPIIGRLFDYSEIDTLLSSFVNPYLERGTEIIHCFFSQTGTRTGRPSCSNPNLLQIPKRTENGRIVRNMFTARSGMELGEADYSAIEPRVMAHLSKDENLCQLFNDSTDFHSWTSERLNISRDRAKVLNLSVGYRATFKSVMAQLKVEQHEAQTQINSWWQLFPRLRLWQEKLIYESKRSGYCTTLLGRRIRVDGLNSPVSWERESAERQLVNNITQGSAAEIMKKAMIKIAGLDCFHPSFGLLIQIYDSLVFESPRIAVDALNVKWAMENCLELDIPLIAEVKTGFRWGEMK